MFNVHGSQFGVYTNKIIEGTSPEFWKAALKQFISEPEYEKKIIFFKENSLDYQTEYKPSIPFYFENTDYNQLLLYYEQELRKEGKNAAYPTNEELLDWYIEQDLEQAGEKKLTILESRNFSVFFTRFTLNLSPHNKSNNEKHLFNYYQELRIKEIYPEINFENKLLTLSNKKVYNRKAQIEETLQGIKELVQQLKEKRNLPEPLGALNGATKLANLQYFYYGDRELYQVNHEEFLDGYGQCKTEGIAFIPTHKQISFDYVEGKNLAMFEMMLPKMFEKSEIGKNEPEKSSKEMLTHKQQILLLRELGVFNTDYFMNLNLIQKGELIGNLLNRDFKNTENYIRYSNGIKDVKEKYNIHTDTNKKKVADLMAKLGISKMK